MSTTETTSVQPRLSPPWYTIQRKLAHTVGLTPGVQVSPPREQEGAYVIAVTAQSGAIGTALATILDAEHGERIQVQVLSPGGEPFPGVPVQNDAQLASLVQTALHPNPLFYSTLIASTAPTLPQRVFAVFQPVVVQFWDDFLFDLYGNFNGVASAVFADILRSDYGQGVALSTTTRLIAGRQSYPT